MTPTTSPEAISSETLLRTGTTSRPSPLSMPIESEATRTSGSVSGTIEGFDFVATESGPAESRDVLIEIFADESQSNEHGRQWLAKLSVLDRILTSPDELAVFTGHVMSKLKGKKKAEAAAAILRAVSEGLEG